VSYTDEQRAFLDDHVWAVLATGRADGSPQQAMVGYTLDDEGRVLVTTPRTTAKWHNAERQPRVSLIVPDGRAHVVVYGEAETIVDDPERAELTADILAVIRGPERPDPSSIADWLEENRRGVLRITPQKVYKLG
jgi:PPOX class probable F420-dependent enzyme